MNSVLMVVATVYGLSGAILIGGGMLTLCSARCRRLVMGDPQR